MTTKVLVLLGPTAVGKTKTALELAKKFNGEIISADSMQVYQGMDIGTAKPTKEERKEIRHHLIDLLPPEKEHSVAQFIELANQAVKDIAGRGKFPIITGGTGLYLKAFIEGFSLPIVKGDPELREKLKKEGSLLLYKKLKEVDPSAAEKLSPNDLRRIIRALEVYELTGTPISKLQSKGVPRPEYEFVIVGLNMERDKLYGKINQRVDTMLAKGLVEEVKKLIDQGYAKNSVAMQALGYKEVADHLEGKLNYPEMVDLIKKRTRHFAKRQMTWFKKFENVKWFNADENFELREIINFAKERIVLL